MAIIVFEHSPLTGSVQLGATLRDYGHRLRIIRIHAGEPAPVDLDNVDGVVSMGGPQSANDDVPALRQEMNYLRMADAAGIPLVGICLGSQLAAKALGGEVARLPGPGAGGIELGWHDVTLTDAGREDIVHTGIPWISKQLHWHHEYVSKLPPGARLLAKSARCPVQAWASGLRTYCFQHHPEVVPETIDAWIADESGDLEEARLTAGQLREQTEQFYPAYDRLRDRLFESIALFLMPVERRYEGLIKDLHH